MPRRSLKQVMFAPFDRGEFPLWLKIVWAPIGLLVFLVFLPFALALILLTCVLVPTFFLFFVVKDRIFGFEPIEVDDEPPSYWPTIERTVPSEYFGELHVAETGQAWLKATLPAFARFGSRYAELADWVYPDLPPPGEISVVLGNEDVSTELTDTSEYRNLYDWLEQHQESIADEIEKQMPDANWLAECLNEDNEPTIPVRDRFRISSAELECGNNVPGYETLVTLRADQTWDIEHAWSVEIIGVKEDGFESLEFGTL